MRNLKNSVFYIIIIGGFSSLMYWIVLHGKDLEIGKKIISTATGATHWNAFQSSLCHNLKEPIAILLVQIITILFVAKVFGWIFKKIGQPSVIGEIIAGIVLGPSLIGMYFPEFSTTLFPKESMPNLKVLSQIGLILFMFVVGMELDLKTLKNKAHDAVVISHASIIIPFALGLGLAYYIYNSYAPKGIEFLSFGLFMGIAMSITAFPVLARIVQERRMHKTKLGAIVITCAAADDITAWCILAAVIAIVKAGSLASALYVILFTFTYVVVMLKVIRPFLKRVGDIHASRENLSKSIVAMFFLTLLLSAFASEAIGIHALFGAFLAGVIMPDNMKFRNLFIEKVEDVSLVLLLPLFFVFTGLRTEIGLLNDPELWKICALIILVAVAGKFFGSALAAKFVGQSWKDSLTIGALMNTRGLMELVVLNIGFDLGVLTKEVFAMMVIMALFTTFMTGPALDFINFLFRKEKEEIPSEISKISQYNILVSFGNPERGRSLLKMGNSLVKKLNKNASITAMHLSLSNELNQFNLDDYEQESFAPIIEESKELGQKITTYFKPSVDIDNDIIGVANKGNFDLLLIGLGSSIYDGTLLGKILGFTTRIISPDRIINKVTGREKLFENSPFDDRIRSILAKTEIPVGLLIDKHLDKIQHVFIPIYDLSDDFLIQYAQKLIHNSNVQVTILDIVGLVKSNTQLREQIRAIEQKAPNHIQLLSERATEFDHQVEDELLDDMDLVIISLESWNQLANEQNTWLKNDYSLLIIKP